MHYKATLISLIFVLRNHKKGICWISDTVTERECTILSLIYICVSILRLSEEGQSILSSVLKVTVNLESLFEAAS